LPRRLKPRWADAYTITEKQTRYARVGEIKKATIEALAGGESPKFDARKVADQLGTLEYNIRAPRIIAGEPRIDGRDMNTVRRITVQTGVLPRTHGSALFTAARRRRS